MSVKLELTGPRVSVLIKELEPSGVSGQCGVALDYMVAAAAPGKSYPVPHWYAAGLFDFTMANTVKGHENS